LYPDTRRPFLFQNGATVDLGQNDAGQGLAINASGDVAGMLFDSGGPFPPKFPTRAFVIRGGTLVNLHTSAIAAHGFTKSVANDLKAGGDVVGGMTGNGDHAFLYSGGSLTDLTTTSHHPMLDAVGINQNRDVVGTANSNNDGYLYNLNSGTYQSLP